MIEELDIDMPEDNNHIPNINSNNNTNNNNNKVLVQSEHSKINQSEQKENNISFTKTSKAKRQIQTDQNSKSQFRDNQSHDSLNNSQEEEEKEPDEPALRIAIIGDERSGKSSLIQCFLKQKIENSKDKYMIHLRTKRYIINNTEVNIIIEELNVNKDKYLLQPFIKKCDIVFLCYALDEDEGEFNPKKIDKLFTSIKAYMEDDPKPIYIVGTKLDLITELIQKRCYVYFDGEDLTSYGCKVRMYVQEKNDYKGNCFKVKRFYITSSLLNINVDTLFLDAMKECYYEYEQKLKEDSTNNNIENNVRGKKCIIF